MNSPRVRRISPVGKEKVYGGYDLPKGQVIKRRLTLKSKLSS